MTALLEYLDSLEYLDLFLQTVSHKSGGGGAWPPISTAYVYTATNHNAERLAFTSQLFGVCQAFLTQLCNYLPQMISIFKKYYTLATSKMTV